MSAQRVRERRRIVFGAGAGALLLTAITAAALGTACIFDQGGYEGGGRRSGTPTSNPTSTPTGDPTSTSTPNDGGQAQQDGNAADS